MTEGAAGDPIVGRVLSGSYRVETRLGAGGMGAVYAARHVRTGKPYAVKVLLPELASRKAALARFRREAHALSAMGHAHVVAIHDWGETPDGLAFLVMDLLEGEDLASRLRRGPLPTALAITLADQVASALEAAHGIGLVHRDLKPANIFLARVPGAGERTVLLDFGLAKSLELESVSAITSAGVVMGTPHYMAPEQAQGGPLDPRTDLWALGVILHEMLCGRPPFDGPSMASLFVQILTAPPPLLRARGVAASEALEALIQRCLAKTPEERFADVSTFRRALHAMGGASAPVPATIAHRATPSLEPSTPQTRATPGSPPSGAYVATPVGNAFARSDEGAPSNLGRSRSWGMWIAVAALLALATIGAGAAIVLAVFVSRPATTAQRPIEREQTSEITDPETVALATTMPSAIEAIDASAQVIDAGTVASPTAVPRGRRGRSRETRAPSPENASPVVSAVPVPAGLDTSAPGMTERIAARPALSRGDWRGCLDALRSAPPTLDVLWDRASCARHAGDRPELERACAAIQRHHAGAPQARACDGMLASLP